MRSRMNAVAVLTVALTLLGSSCTILERRLQANEDNAIQTIRLVNNALAAQKLQAGAPSYAPSISALGNAAPRELACGDAKCVYHGYSFEYRADGTKYVLVARPNRFGNTGRRSFLADETGVIRFTNDDRAATVEDRPVS